MNPSPRGSERTVMELSLATSHETVDPVCGMSVDPATAKGSHQHNGRTYHFCSGSCLKKFQNDPDKYLGGHRDEMHSVSASRSQRLKPNARYICPMDPDV